MNRAELIGRIGKEPEVRTLDSGVKVASVSMATTDRAYKTKDGREIPERTEWHNLVLWNGLAQTAEKYIHKGDRLFVEGEIRTRSYEDSNGVKKCSTEIFVRKIEMLSSKSQGTAPSDTPSETPVTTQEDDLPF